MDVIIGKEFPEKVIPLIDRAKGTIDVVVFDWRWYPQNPGSPVQLFNQSVARAIKRGVVVRAVANTPEIVGILNQIGARAKKLNTPKLVHAKFIIIDDQYLVIGSHNYTETAFLMNYEVSVIIEDEKVVKRVKEFFNNLYGSVS
jgi:phosphatidylserine/phosphatidylglycerophosphate/cardiolipin synthase-like enzyme